MEIRAVTPDQVKDALIAISKSKIHDTVKHINAGLLGGEHNIRMDQLELGETDMAATIKIFEAAGWQVERVSLSQPGYEGAHGLRFFRK